MVITAIVIIRIIIITEIITIQIIIIKRIIILTEIITIQIIIIKRIIIVMEIYKYTIYNSLFIGPTFVGAPTYVDDVCLISNDPRNLQQMLNTAQSYADVGHYSFSTDKSVIIVIGESSTSRHTAQQTRLFYFEAEGGGLCETSWCCYLQSTSHLNRATEISSFRNAFLSLPAIGTRYSQLNPATSLFLVKSFCLPIPTFSFCIWSPP